MKNNESEQDDKTGKIDEIADQLDDIKAAVDELEDEMGADRAVGRLKTAVDRASDAADDLEEGQG